MEKIIQVTLSEEDKEFLIDQVRIAVDEKLEGNAEEYSILQQQLLKLPTDSLISFLSCFAKAFEENNKKVKGFRPARYGIGELLATINTSKTEKGLTKKLLKMYPNLQAVVVFEVINLALKLKPEERSVNV